jgi:hypothetical protein
MRMFSYSTSGAKHPLRPDKALQMPIFHGEKTALLLPSPMVANFAGVKANNRSWHQGNLRFTHGMLNNCHGTKI